MSTAVLRATRLFFCTLASLLILAAGYSAHADVSVESSVESTASAGNSSQLDEIVVTAQKREQRLADVGITVTALTGQQLENAGVTDISQLEKVTPGFSASTSNHGLTTFAIRGIGYDADQLSAAPTVSVYLDEAPLPYLAMTGDVMLDLERVEVIKGPQGTLYGNNSTGGSINFIAAKPTETFSAGIKANYDNFGQFFTEGFVSGPLTDTLSARFAASTTQGGAWQETYTSGPRLWNGTADRGSERLLLEWRATDKLKISVNENAYIDKSQPQEPQLLGYATPSPGSTYVDPRYGSLATYPTAPQNDRAADFTQDPKYPYINDKNFYQTVLRGDLELSNSLTLTSITNYAQLDTSQFLDLDATRIDVLEAGDVGTIRTYSEELRLAGDFRDIGLNVIAGGNYSNDRIHEDQPEYFPHFNALPANTLLDTYQLFSNEQEAAFADAEWRLTPQVSFTGGIRDTADTQGDTSCLPDSGDGKNAASQGSTANFLRSLNGLGPTNAYVAGKCVTIGPAQYYLPFQYQNKVTNHNISWRMGMNYKPTDDLLLYGVVNRGYKAGGYSFQNAVLANQFTRVKQEEVTAYEVGTKYSSRIFSLSAGAYYNSYINKQTYALSEAPIFGAISLLTNIPKSQTYGLDTEATLKPIHGLTLHAAANYLQTKILNAGDLGLDTFGQPINLVGHRLNYAPTWSSTFDSEYRVPVRNRIDGLADLSGVYNSKAYGDLGSSDLFAIKAYTTLDARIGLASEDGWTATVWVRNMADTYFWTSTNFAFAGVIGRTTGLPRTVGASVSYGF